MAGACAFQVEDGLLTFLGGFDVTDYMGPVARPGLGETFAEGAAHGRRGRGRVGARRPSRPGRPRALGRAARVRRRRAGVPHRARRRRRVPHPRAAGRRTTSTWPRCPSKLRHEIRRKERRLDGRVRRLHGRVRHARDASRAVRPVHRAAPAELGPQGQVHARRHGDLLPPPRRGVPPVARLPPGVHRDRRRGGGRRDRVRLQGHVLALQLGVRPSSTRSGAPAWC